MLARPHPFPQNTYHPPCCTRPAATKGGVVQGLSRALVDVRPQDDVDYPLAVFEGEEVVVFGGGRGGGRRATRRRAHVDRGHRWIARDCPRCLVPGVGHGVRSSCGAVERPMTSCSASRLFKGERAVGAVAKGRVRLLVARRHVLMSCGRVSLFLLPHPPTAPDKPNFATLTPHHLDRFTKRNH